MGVAVCINCGNLKSFTVEVCTACDFRPDSIEEKVKSILLSTEDIGDLKTGKTKAELLAIAPLVAAHTYAFDEGEVKALAAAMEESLAVPFSSMLFELFKFLLPGLVVLGFAIFLWLNR
jgi:hypothetical protein